MKLIDSNIDIAKSFDKLIENMEEIARDESRTNLEKFVSLKYAVQLHVCECKKGMGKNVPAADPNDLRFVNI